MTRRFASAIAGTLTAFLLATPCSHAGDPAADAAWAQIPEILSRIVPPTFPNADFPITDFGAVEGAEIDCGEAIAAAIAKCAESGGGRVVVPAGKFLTGPVHLRSMVDLHLSDGAELIFSDRFEDYLPVVRVRVGGIDCFNYSPLVYAKDCTDIAITGKGRLNGNSAKWWKWKGKETTRHFQMGAENAPLDNRVFGTPGDAIRPNFVVLMDCRNILLENFTIGSGPNWTIHPVYSENITIRGITVDTDGPNNDGIDPDSCRDLLIERCTFSTGDDCVVLKSGYNEDGWRVARPTENVIMRHCSSRHGHGGLVIGSEMSGGVRNVFLHDCEFEGTDRAIRIKSRRDRGGVVEKIYARDIKVRDMMNEVVILNMDYGADKNAVQDGKPPVFRDMCFERITADGTPVALRITGDPEATIANIRFRDMKLISKEGVFVRNARDIVFEDIRLDVKKGAMFQLDSVRNIALNNVTTTRSPETFLKLDGRDSRGIGIRSCPAARGRIELGKQVSKLAVVEK